MDCAKAADLTARVVSGNAAPADEAALRTHAAACGGCADALRRASKVWALMGRLPEIRPLRPADPAALIRPRVLPFRAIAAVAAALLLAVAGALVFRPAPSELPPAAAAAPAPAVEPPAAPPSPEQILVERELDVVVREKETARAPEPEPMPAPAVPLPPEKKQPLAVQPAPAPAPEKKAPEAPVVKAPPPPAPPEPPAPKPAVAARETLPTAATVDRVEGQVVATINGETVPVRAAFRLTDGDAIATSGKASQAVLAYEDGTRLVLGGDSAIGRVLRQAEGGKRIEIAQGVVAAQVGRRAADDSLTFSTPHADARVLGTRLVLLVSATSTRLDVKEGRVKLTRKGDGASVDVSADHYAIAGKGLSLASRTIPGPKIALRESFDAGRWSAAWAPFVDAGQGVSVAAQEGSLRLSVRGLPGEDVTPGTLQSDLKKSLDQLNRVSTLAPKKDWARAGALETRGGFAFSKEAPLRIRLNAWASVNSGGRAVWIGLNRGLPGQGISLERQGDVLRLRVDGAAAPAWQRDLPCAQEWETLELWLSKEQLTLRRNGLTLTTLPHPLKAKAAQLSLGVCAKAELPSDEETRIDDLEVAWVTASDFEQISR